MVESRCGILCSKCRYREEVNCQGCSVIDKPFWGDSCPVKDCCEERKYDHCGQCPDIPCDLLTQFSYDKEQGDNGKRIKTCRTWAAIEKADKIINSKTSVGDNEWNRQYCTLSLIDLDGYPFADTISIAKADGIRWLTFCTGLSSRKVKRINKSNRASVCVNSSGYNITLVGTVEVLTDPAIKKEMWYVGTDEYYSGSDDPDYCVLRFNTERYMLWFAGDETEGVL